MKISIKSVSLSIVFSLVLAASILAAGSWTLGPYILISGPSSGPLQARMNGASGLSSYGFVGSVGGVAFEAVAVPDVKLAGKSIRLDYDPKRADGSRLIVLIENQPYRPYLPDWKLIPIAKYASSEFNACVSLFGPKANRTFYDIVYHPAFENTLLGVRLLQADIILMNLNEFWKLPEYNGKILTGAGESTQTSQHWKKAAVEISQVMQGASFQSWVMTDFDEKVVFKVKNGNLELAGFPYYYFWRADFHEYRKKMNEYKTRASKLRNQGKITEHNRVVQEANKLKPRVFAVDALTKNLKSKRDAIQKFNPSVYDSAAQTMRFSAFFRFMKLKHPNSWKSFLKSIKNVSVKPSVDTPTKWKKSS